MSKKTVSPQRKKPVWMLPIGLGLAVSVGVFIYTFIGEQPQTSAKPVVDKSVIFSSPHSYSKPVQEAKTVKMNETVSPFTATDINGQAFRLTDWDGKFKLLFFADLSCPCVQAYTDRIKALYEKYNPQDVEIAYVFSDANDSLRKIRERSEQDKFPWRSLVDADQKLMTMFNVQCTTEVFLIDRDNHLRYHGRVDDSIFEPEKAKSHDLDNAINALLEGKPVPVQETQAYACTIPKIKTGKDATPKAKPAVS